MADEIWDGAKTIRLNIFALVRHWLARRNKKADDVGQNEENEEADRVRKRT